MMYGLTTAKDEAIKAMWLEKKRRQDLWLQLMRENTPESIAKARQIEEEDEAAAQQKQAQIEAQVRLLKESEQQDAQAIQNGKVLQRFGDYRQLYFYKKGKVIFDLTFLFANRYITEHPDRTKDQMIQSARSGKQNFVEGLQDGQASVEQAIYLVSIGQGSLQELREDYEDYLRTRHLPFWKKDHPRYNKLVEFCKSHNDIEDYAPLLEKMNDEEMANVALTLIHQTDVLIEGFLKRIEKDFTAHGDAKTTIHNIRRHFRL